MVLITRMAKPCGQNISGMFSPVTNLGFSKQHRRRRCQVSTIIPRMNQIMPSNWMWKRIVDDHCLSLNPQTMSTSDAKTCYSIIDHSCVFVRYGATAGCFHVSFQTVSAHTLISISFNCNLSHIQLAAAFMKLKKMQCVHRSNVIQVI